MEKPETSPQLLYEGYRLVYPVEFKPDHYLVRSCNNERADWKCTDRVFNGQWEWVHNKRQLQVLQTNESLLYSQPTVVGDRGFFWFAKYNEPHFITLSFKGKNLDSPKVPFDNTTSNIECDQSVQRCLLLLQRGETTDRKLIYQYSSYYAGTSCDLPNLSGFSDGFSLTPDGKYAVTAMAERAELPRRVVVMRFKPGACQPEFFHSYSLEEK
jgi:hypothetical protein